jgi:hypothetical protein
MAKPNMRQAYLTVPDPFPVTCSRCGDVLVSAIGQWRHWEEHKEEDARQDEPELLGDPIEEFIL